MAQRISIEEYNNSDYTKKALKELNEQMKEFEFKTSKDRRVHEEEEDEDSDSEFEDGKKIVFVRHNGSSKKRKANVDQVSTNEYLHGLQQRIEKLQKVLDKQSDELDTAEIRLYQTKLELSNANVSLDCVSDNLTVSKKANIILAKKLLITKAKFYGSVALNVVLAYYALF